jgi:hypothetical protein
MGKPISCPACDAELLLEGNEQKGDEVFCVYCSAPYKITKVAEDDSDAEVEDDY